MDEVLGWPVLGIWSDSRYDAPAPQSFWLGASQSELADLGATSTLLAKPMLGAQSRLKSGLRGTARRRPGLRFGASKPLKGSLRGDDYGCVKLIKFPSPVANPGLQARGSSYIPL